MSGLWSFRNDGIDGGLREKHVSRALEMECIVGQEIHNAAPKVDDDEEEDVMGLLAKLRSFVGVEERAELDSVGGDEEGEEEDMCSVASGSTDGAITRLREMLCIGSSPQKEAPKPADDVTTTMASLHKKAQEDPVPRADVPLLSSVTPDDYDPRLYPGLFAVQLEAEKGRERPLATLPAAYDTTNIIRPRKKRAPLDLNFEKPTWNIDRQPLCGSVTSLQNESPRESPLQVAAVPLAHREPLPLPSPSFTVSPTTVVSMSIDDLRARLTPLSENGLSVSPITVMDSPAVPMPSALTPQFSASEPTCMGRPRRTPLPQVSCRSSLPSVLHFSRDSALSVSLSTSFAENVASRPLSQDKAVEAQCHPIVDSNTRACTGDARTQELVLEMSESTCEQFGEVHKGLQEQEPSQDPAVRDTGCLLVSKDQHEVDESTDEQDEEEVFKLALAKHFHNKICVKRALLSWKRFHVTQVQDVRAERVVKLLRRGRHVDCMGTESPVSSASVQTSTDRGTSPATCTESSQSSTKYDVFSLKASKRREKRLRAREELQNRYLHALEQKKQADEMHQQALEEQATKEKKAAQYAKREKKKSELAAKKEKEERKKVLKAKTTKAVLHYHRVVAGKCLMRLRSNVAMSKALREEAECRGRAATLQRSMCVWKDSCEQWRRVHMISFVFRCITLRRLLLQCFKRGFLRRWRGVVTAKKLDAVNAARLDRQRVQRIALGQWRTALHTKSAKRDLSAARQADELLSAFMHTKKRRLFTSWKDKVADKLNQQQRLQFRRRMANAIKDLVGDAHAPLAVP